MAKKNNVSINALKKYCDQTAPKVVEQTIPLNEEESLTFTIKPRLSLDECVRFIEDVVSEYVNAQDLMIVPIAKEFILGRNLLTYYANFTMPTKAANAFDLVMGAGDIMGVILEHIDMAQYKMLVRSIDERVRFEERRALTLQEVKINQAITEIEQFTSRMATLFEGVDGDQMSKFISGMADMAQRQDVTPQDIATALVNHSTKAES